MIQNTINPLQYSTYVPQQVDIENNIEIRINNKFIVALERDITKLQTRLDSNDAQMGKLKKEFHDNVKLKMIDCIVGIVLFVVIYVKVYTSS